MKQLSPEVRARVRLLQGLIQAKQLEVEALQLGLEQLIEREAGIDLVRQQWQLDSDTGLLQRSAEDKKRGSHQP